MAAFIPQNQESLLSIAQSDKNSEIGKFLHLDKKAGLTTINKEGVGLVFASDAPRQVQDYIASHIKPEPLKPLATPMQLTPNNFGKVGKTAVLITWDKVTSYPLQREMTKNAGITRYYTAKLQKFPAESSC